MYCDKCGRLAHGNRPCGTIANVSHGQPSPVISPHGPTMVVVSPPNRRLESGGWFARSFATTAGVVAALLLLPAAGCVLMIVLATAGSLMESDNGLTKDAKRIAMESMTRFGIQQLSSDSHASRSGTDVLLTGSAKTGSGAIRPYFVRFRVARFDSEERWVMRSLIIDGKEHLSPSDP